ncbi:MAG: HAD-IA family hydrolase [Microbacteriaceae bacterium]|nr:HAD-IA family hydrolase [Microbacteriaceae bacterium]
MGIRHLIWDMGGTLIDTYPAVDRMIVAVAERHGARVEPDEVARATRTTSIADTMTAIAARHGIERDEFDRAYDELRASWRDDAPPAMAGAREAIAAVRAAGGKSIVVTHRDRASAETLLAATGLEVDGLISVDDGHPRKPDPGMFRLALERYDLDPAESLAVGDRGIDLAGAARAGVAGVLFAPIDGVEQEVPDGTARIARLAELVGMLDTGSERARMLAGALYSPDDPALAADRVRARRLARAYDDIDPGDEEARRELLRRLLGGLGDIDGIEPPLRVDYGTNIRIGDGVFMNFGCVLLDVAPITIGDRVLLGPGVQLCTPGHPLDAASRAGGLEFGRPIVIGDDVWLGAGAIVLGGVTIGAGTVVGAGAVVTRDLPAGAIAVGNPARVVRDAPGAPGDGAD